MILCCTCTDEQWVALGASCGLLRLLGADAMWRLSEPLPGVPALATNLGIAQWLKLA